MNNINSVTDNNKKVLLICPFFFNYEKKIRDELIHQGFDVILWNDKVSSSVIYKIVLRCFPKITSKLSEIFFFRKKLLEIKNFTFEAIIIIKGESLSVNFIKTLLLKLNHKYNYYYLWDSINNTHDSINKAKCFKKVGSFDPLDANLHNWDYKPLFSSVRSDSSVTNNLKWDLCFAGTVHSDRLQVLQRIKNNLPTKFSFFCFAYIPSSLILFIKKIIYPVFRKFNQSELAVKPLSYEKLIDIFNTSRAIIDIEHFSQRGLTMRSIEVIMSGKKLITTNKTIITSDLYHSSRVLLIDRANPIIDESFLYSNYQPLSETLKEKYFIATFVKQLISSD